MAGRDDIRYYDGNCSGYTGLELVIVAAILFLAVALIVQLATGFFQPSGRGGGMIPSVLDQDGDQLNVFGSIAGFPATSGSTGGISVLRSNPDPHRLGAVEMTISLFLGGTGGIDMAQTNVTWTDSAGTEVLSLTKDTPVVCPNWTIVRKYNVNPFKTADKDDILEPGEQFDVFVCPSHTLAPYEKFTVVFDPPGSSPRFPVKCSVPFTITPTMVL